MTTSGVNGRPTRTIARPLKVLIPLIRNELEAGDFAGLMFYQRAGAMLLEAKTQIPYGNFGAWLARHFKLSKKTAYRYMTLARRAEAGRVVHDTTLHAAIGERQSDAARRMQATAPALDREFPFPQDVDELRSPAERERVRQEEQARLERKRALAQQLIDLGYRALALRLHPDRGGSADDMTALPGIRDQLESFAKSARFL